MPICVHCNYPARSVYTVYQSARNTRLDVCAKCSRFTDPLIEHPPLLILLDLVLLKPRVYRHLVFNRECEPYRAGGVEAAGIGGVVGAEVGNKDEGQEDERKKGLGLGKGLEGQRDKWIWKTIIQLGLIVTLVESLVIYRQTIGFNSIASSSPNPAPGSQRAQPSWDWTNRDIQVEQLGVWLKILVGVFLGNIAQHLATTLIACAFLYYLGWIGRESASSVNRQGTVIRDTKTKDMLTVQEKRGTNDIQGRWEDGRRRDFRTTMISLTLLYASVLPLCLHVVLLIWPGPITTLTSTTTTTSSSSSFFYLPTPLIHLFSHLTAYLPTILIEQDSNWISTHLLSGMSSGLALRVLLPTKPAGTMGAVLGGWAVRGLVVHWVEEVWRGGIGT